MLSIRHAHFFGLIPKFMTLSLAPEINTKDSTQTQYILSSTVIYDLLPDNKPLCNVSDAKQ